MECLQLVQRYFDYSEATYLLSGHCTLHSFYLLQFNIFLPVYLLGAGGVLLVNGLLIYRFHQRENTLFYCIDVRHALAVATEPDIYGQERYTVIEFTGVVVSLFFFVSGVCVCVCYSCVCVVGVHVVHMLVHRAMCPGAVLHSDSASGIFTGAPCGLITTSNNLYLLGFGKPQQVAMLPSSRHTHTHTHTHSGCTSPSAPFSHLPRKFTSDQNLLTFLTQIC